jgi:hypothetical protein
MSINNESRKNYNSTILISGIIAAGAILLFVYLMWYVAPEQIVERVKIIAITEDGCIVETPDGFAVNIGECYGEPGDYTLSEVDQKVKERAAMMNPTR